MTVLNHDICLFADLLRAGIAKVSGDHLLLLVSFMTATKPRQFAINVSVVVVFISLDIFIIDPPLMLSH